MEIDSIEKNQIYQNRIQRWLLAIAQAVTLLLLPLLFIWDSWDIGQLSSGIAVICLCLISFLVLSFHVYKEPHFWVWMMTYLWIGCTAFYCGDDLVSSFGGWLIRKWLICGMFFLTAVLQKKEDRARWFKLIIILTVSVISFCCLSAELTASASLLIKKQVMLPVKGSLINGRLSAFGNPNRLAPISAIGCMGTLSLMMCLLQDKRKRSLCFAVLFTILLIDCLALGWSRSRGTFIAISLAVGIFVFSQVFLFGKTKKLLKVPHSIAAMLLAASLTFGILISVKPVTSKWINLYSDKVLESAEADYVQTQLSDYGIGYGVSTMTDRTLYWRAVIEMMDDEPMLWVTGLTARRYKINMITGAYENRPEKSAYYEHNGYLDVLFLHGIPGAFLCAVLLCNWILCGIYTIFSRNKSSDMLLQRGSAAIAFMIIVNGMVENYPFPTLSHFPQTYLFFLISGVCWASFHFDNRRETDNET